MDGTVIIADINFVDAIAAKISSIKIALAVRSQAIGVVIAELESLPALAARRLQLAAQVAGTAVLAVQRSRNTDIGGFSEKERREEIFVGLRERRKKDINSRERQPLNLPLAASFRCFRIEEPLIGLE